MGLCSHKPEEEDPVTGLTGTETRMLRNTWHHYCVANRDYAVVIFLSFFIKWPDSKQLFPRFRNRPVGDLPKDPQFRAHAISVSFQLTAMVDCADDAVLLEALIRKNAVAHSGRRGVMPEHFRLLGSTVVEVLQTMDERCMTPAAMIAWKKLFDYMEKITEKVFEEQRERFASVSSFAVARKAGASGRASGSASPGSQGKRSPKASQSPPKSGQTSGYGTPAGGKSPASSTPKQSQSPRAARPPKSASGSSPKSTTPKKAA
ncbi:hypothetical protein HPB50_005038 [Hyalomma asiaticum]|uniref:Uncharacterized protein n=1 Tax=Hyalomma asiaticum TaxID=266040 RepID=A0ACB7SVG7_HYAAI|nr:hypothetical protein HPB50_005038 [Hyalomma asiaticum]